MISPTYGKLELSEVAEKIFEYYQKNKHFGSEFNIIVGTDSQNFSNTKVVVVITIQCVGHGGIYFYDIQRVNKIANVRLKLNYETSQSLHYADNIIKIFEENDKYQEMFLNTGFKIHVDAGNSDSGKTKGLIPEIVGWIKSCGYECEVKPDSFAASSIADRISK